MRRQAAHAVADAQRAVHRNELFDVEHDPDEMSDLAPAGKHDLAPYEEMLRSVVGDYEQVDAAAKDVDHWLFEQWFLLAGHGQKPTLQHVWKAAYDATSWASAKWAVEWQKAKKWMAL